MADFGRKVETGAFMANKQKPDNVHLLQGTYRTTRHGEVNKKPKCKVELGDPPAWMSVEAKHEWYYARSMLDQLGLLTGADKTILAQYSVLAADFAASQELFSAAKHTQLRMCQLELGMTPAARGKITVDNPDVDEF